MLTIATIAITLLYVVLIVLLIVGLVQPSAGHNQAFGQLAQPVSVVVAFRNEAPNLTRLLEALSRQTLDASKWELIMVDDGSTDGGDKIAQSFHNLPGLRLVKLQKGITGKKQALLFGVELARFNLVAITDADCVPVATWLNDISRRANGYALLQGCVLVERNSNLLSWFEALDYASLMAVSAGSFGLKRPVVAASANLVFRKDMINVRPETLRVDVASGDDMFLLHEVKKDHSNNMLFSTNLAGSVLTRFDGGFVGAIRRRRRWASKAPAYTDIETILVGLIVLVFNLWLLVLPMICIFNLVSWNLLVGSLLVASLANFCLLFIYLKQTNQLKLMLVFLPLQLIYPIYLCTVAIAGFAGGQNWKGRAVSWKN